MQPFRLAVPYVQGPLRGLCEFRAPGNVAVSLVVTCVLAPCKRVQDILDMRNWRD